MALKSFFVILYLAAVWIHKNRAYAAPISQDLARAYSLPYESSTRYSFVLLGATGDLSKRKIYPALWTLYRSNLLPKDLRIFGYARKQRTVDFLRKSCEPYVTVKPGEEELYDKFWQLNSYVPGTDGQLSDYETINKAVEAFENGEKANRIFYLALPPSVFESATSNIKAAAMAKVGSTRVIIEKPFGHDYESSEKLSNHLSNIFTEDQIYRIDHYLGYEMVQNMFALRFANRLFAPVWNKENIAAVRIDFAEHLGVEGRGNYFDSVGIIRDVMQNHLLQIMSLIAMDKPKSNHADDIRDSKVKLLHDTKTITLDDVVLGQYVANPDSNDPKAKVGYREDPSVPDDSITPTFALTVLHVDNEQWKDVPFIIRAGKGLNKKLTEIVIQFKNVSDNIFETQPIKNELIIKLKNPHAMQIKLASKVPGYSTDLEGITVDFNYDIAYKDVKVPEPYERLILDVFKGFQLNFVRTDELREAWRLFTPILHDIEKSKIQPAEYLFGSTGPQEADKLEKKYNFLKQN